MAKRPDLDNPLYSTGPEGTSSGQRRAADNSDLDKGRIISSGVGITQGELAALDALAERLNTTRNSLMHMAVRQFIERVRAGEFDPGSLLQEPEEPPKRRYVRRR